MISEETKLLLEDMLSHARDAVEFHNGLDAAALEVDRMRRSAVIREAEVVGEAASKIRPEQRALLPGVPWKEAIRFRNFLIHGYDHVRTAILVDTVRDDFPPLIAEIERILSKGTQGDGDQSGR